MRMTKKGAFNADEWQTLVEAPMLAGLYVASSGRGGALRESLAMAHVYADVRQTHGESELLDELAATPPALDPSRLQAGGDLGAAATQRLSEALEILRAHGSSDDVDAYRRFVETVAEAVAAAHREGGVLGLGGKQISEDEQAALDLIAAVLGKTRT
jgi:hypothetical protein